MERARAIATLYRMSDEQRSEEGQATETESVEKSDDVTPEQEAQQQVGDTNDQGAEPEKETDDDGEA